VQKTGQRLHVLNASASEVDAAFVEIGRSSAKALLVGHRVEITSSASARPA